MNKGSQTLNKFKRNQIVSTSIVKDQDKEAAKEVGISAMNWQILESANEEKNKKEDDGKAIQRKLERKIRRELKDRLKRSKEFIDVDDSISMHRSQLSESYSIMDTKLSSSMHSSRRPKVRGSTETRVKDSHDKSKNVDKSVRFNLFTVSILEKFPSIITKFIFN
jgi:hypothetical protein